jgi:hypothetical protein
MVLVPYLLLGLPRSLLHHHIILWSLLQCPLALTDLDGDAAEGRLTDSDGQHFSDNTPSVSWITFLVAKAESVMAARLLQVLSM